MSLYPWDVPYWTTIWGENSCEGRDEIWPEGLPKPIKKHKTKKAKPSGDSSRDLTLSPNVEGHEHRLWVRVTFSLTHHPQKDHKLRRITRRLLWTQSCVPPSLWHQKLTLQKTWWRLEDGHRFPNKKWFKSFNQRKPAGCFCVSWCGSTKMVQSLILVWVYCINELLGDPYFQIGDRPKPSHGILHG